MDIKASDLRRGNLIHEEVLGNCKVFEIRNRTIIVVVDCLETDGSLSKRLYTLNYNHANIIPLTEELLLRLGFEKQIGFIKFIGERFKESSFEVAHNDKCKWYCYFRNFNKGDIDDFVLLRNDLKYLHELQNLFHSLTGKELELKNPPVKDQ